VSGLSVDFTKAKKEHPLIRIVPRDMRAARELWFAYRSLTNHLPETSKAFDRYKAIRGSEKEAFRMTIYLPNAWATQRQEKTQTREVPIEPTEPS
jgi:hypothetical protein